ncbi:glycogen debranching protein GlgX [Rhizobium sp. YJ-22]|uniref:glycogen debranching protein GlgX n=1 Tax=Rhizobium sp. YJ-22 TaxID=3037556 RepID=UPI002412705C|nr:glycogen debranching protein GlgX [Rhizobium sp. YJ-22]MDG3578806.1 glycogen debranching protein GlgX [Rhizobium sp. YJ-22]
MEDSFSRQGGAILFDSGVEFAVRSPLATHVDLCLFDGQAEVRLPMERDGDIHRMFVDDLKPGARYGFRADGVYDPDKGFWFDPAKLLVDPYATELDRPFRHDARLSQFGTETADLVPKAIVRRHRPVKRQPPLFRKGGFIYEVAVRPFTMLHPEVPEAQRGTVAALAHPAIIAHLKRLGVDAVELMPITAWIDERHLPPLGLTNGWGYNPIAFMALDPRVVPGGVAELADTVAALRAEGIGVILDLVFNHTGESDRHGATLSLRGLDNLTAYRHHRGEPGHLVNDTGTGNTVACDHPHIRQMIVESLRHFVLHAAVDGFRFDLAPVLGRTADGFSRDSETLAAIHADEVLADRVLIAEPWDIGPGGYQLGNFPKDFLEWNDRARDDLRRYWRGDARMTGALATALAGSSDIFQRDGAKETRSVNFIAAHDGFTLHDLVAYEHKHNEANGEDNRDGHGENFSWNNGVEGETEGGAVLAGRRADLAALLGTLFSARGTVMLTAGDEGGRSQGGNNNAYCQDNAITWIEWSRLDDGLIAHTAFLSGLRKRFDGLSAQSFFTGADGDVVWATAGGEPMTVADWEDEQGATLAMVIRTPDRETGRDTRLAILLNRAREGRRFRLPPSGRGWRLLSPAAATPVETVDADGRSVLFCVEL